MAELYEQQQDQIGKAVLPQPTEAVQKPPTVADMKQRLASAIPVDESELRALVRQRAEQMRDGLIEVGELAEERVFLLKTDPTASGNEQIRSRLTIAAGS